jgi:hypothetical protein
LTLIEKKIRANIQRTQEGELTKPSSFIEANIMDEIEG